MKKNFVLISALLSVTMYLDAQAEENPFVKYGLKKVMMATFSKGEFEEFHKNKEIVEIGSILYNTKTKEVTGYIEESIENEVTSATPAMSIDPLCEKYPWISPYAYCLNNPVRFIDPDGRDVVILNAPKGAGGRGHMAAIIQDKSGQWHYMTMGAAEGGSSKMFSEGVQGGMVVMALGTNDRDKALSLAKQDTNNAEYTETVDFTTSSEMDERIYNNAISMKESINSGEVKYNALTNNCADAVVKTVSSGTGVEISTTSDPRPNSVFKEINNNQTQTQKDINAKVVQEQNQKLKETVEYRGTHGGVSTMNP